MYRLASYYFLETSWVNFFIFRVKSTHSGITENATLPSKNSVWCQKIAQSIIQKSKKANKFAKIMQVISKICFPMWVKNIQIRVSIRKKTFLASFSIFDIRYISSFFLVVDCVGCTERFSYFMVYIVLCRMNIFSFSFFFPRNSTSRISHRVFRLVSLRFFIPSRFVMNFIFLYISRFVRRKIIYFRYQ